MQGDYHDSRGDLWTPESDSPGSEAEGAWPRFRDPLCDQEQSYLVLLFTKYRGSLYRYLNRLVSSRDDVAEMVQETYCRIMRHPEAIKFEAVARAYLFQTATNIAREYYRQRKRRHASQHIDLDEIEMPADGLLPEQGALWEETLARLKAEVNAMPPEWRDVVLLHRFENKTYSEIANALGVSTRTIERRMSQAMEFLATRLRGVL